MLLTLGRVARNGSSALAWLEAQPALADLVAEFGPVSKTPRAQSAAYPFTRLRSDGVWLLDVDVPMDNVGRLNSTGATGRLDPPLEAALSADTALLFRLARELVESNFPATVAPEVLAAVGLDPDAVLHPLAAVADAGTVGRRRSRLASAGLAGLEPAVRVLRLRRAGQRRNRGTRRRRTCAGSPSTAPTLSTTA